MRQTFIKTVQGHTLEFNRLLYPTKYAILSQDVIHSGIVIVVEKDEKGTWSVKSFDKLPGWISEITSKIYDVIEENEANAL